MSDGARRVSHSDGSDFVPKRPKFGSASVTVGGAGPSRVLTPSPIVPAQVTPTRELAFFVRPYNISHSKAVPMGDEYDREFNTPGSDPMIITAACQFQPAPVDLHLLHEIIHSYLFIVCGLKARREGGHTEGFRQIATMIDKWAGPEHLRLQEMEADLGSYLTDQSKPATTQVVLQRPVMEQTFQHQPAQQPSQWGGHFPDEMHGDTRTTRYSSLNPSANMPKA
ncbi:unnamed protein product [Parascedosporium putredinis]|uniref:SprT-like domain-containing protein n=1 Tax=Parascedosporium putredinis TaxID=1442378 RepID=A0A9P1MDX5_9PEZI|nr:unnamed protein product [Parascedosporium putredinis]CAI8003465.1 unnamed protein product [Parascedosporium putredinis]